MNKTIAVVVVVAVLVIVFPLVGRLLRGPSDSAQPAPTTTRGPADGPLAMVTVNLQGTEVSCTALGAAVWNGDQQRVKEFLDAGADINAPLAVRIPGTPEYSTYAICMAVEAVALCLAQRSRPGVDGNAPCSRDLGRPGGHCCTAARTWGRPNAPLDRPGMTLLKLATGMRQPAVADVLRRHGAR
jgi:hypothetical protein